MPPAFRQLTSVLLKRKPIVWNFPYELKPASFGHWWLELLPPAVSVAESYGWWPDREPKLFESFAGVPGDLNGQAYFGGTPTTDVYHATAAPVAINPWVPVADGRTDTQIADCLRTFATSYTGPWQWVFEFGQNCHSFQKQAVYHCKLWERPPRK